MPRKKISHLLAAAASIGLVLAMGCATNGALSTEKISQGERSIRDARQSNASLTALPELKMAEDKLADAKAAFANKEYEKAGRLAEQAQVDADYARARADAAKSKRTAGEMRKNIENLRQEIERLSKQ